MRILYENIGEEGLEIERGFSFEEDGDRLDIRSFKGRIDRTGDTYVLSGSMNVVLTCPCDRCLEPVEEELTQDVSVTLSPTGGYPAAEKKDDEGLTDEEAGLYVTPEEYLDLDELLREEALLAVPPKRLCRQDCRGICPDCGALLNKEDCKCGPKTDPRFSALEKFRNN